MRIQEKTAHGTGTDTANYTVANIERQIKRSKFVEASPDLKLVIRLIRQDAMQCVEIIPGRYTFRHQGRDYQFDCTQYADSSKKCYFFNGEQWTWIDRMVSDRLLHAIMLQFLRLEPEYIWQFPDHYTQFSPEYLAYLSMECA